MSCKNGTVTISTTDLTENRSTAFPIRLRMEVMAYNYLVEHFAGPHHLPDTELCQEDDAHWILDTVVHGLGPLRWFYVMLADKIEILDSPAADALKEEVRRFVEKHLQ